MGNLKFHEDFDSAFEIFFKNPNKIFSSIFEPIKPDYPVDVVEYEECLAIEVPCVGLKKNDVKVSVENDVVSISYDKPNEEKSGVIYHKRMIARRNFDLSFKLSKGYDSKNAKATLEDGLLTIRIPKIKEIKESKVSISVN